MGEGGRIPYEARILRIAEVGPETRAFFLERPAGLTFLPGQFLSFLLPIGSAVLTRPYTIASSPEESDAVEIVLNRVPGGPGSAYLFGLSAGAVLSFTGPWGSFTLSAPPAAECVFIAGGTGIAAIRPMLRRALAGPGAHLRLHHAVPSAAHLLYRDEFEQAAQAQPRFEYQPLVAAAFEPMIESRYVSGDADRTRHFFICGIGDVVLRLRDLLRRSGYVRRAVQYEKW